MCTSAPVVGVNTSMSDSTIATKLIHIDRVMLALIVLTVALESRFKYGIFEISSLIKATSAASTAMSLPILPIATLTSAVFNWGVVDTIANHADLVIFSLQFLNALHFFFGQKFRPDFGNANLLCKIISRFLMIAGK